MKKLAVRREACARVPTSEGEFHLCIYTDNHEKNEHLALTMGNIAHRSDILVRLHSECFTGDVLGSRRCDCGEQLHQAMRRIAREGAGLLIYLPQEGRGIGLLDKLRAYNLQDQGYDTVDANLLLGHQADERDYTVAALILEDMQIESIRLLTNNPDKIESLRRLGIQVNARIPLMATVNDENAGYIMTKTQRMRHMMGQEHRHEIASGE